MSWWGFAFLAVVIVPTQQDNFLTQGFIRDYAVIQIYRVLIGFLAFLVWKLWFKNSNFDKNEVLQKVTLAILAESHNSPAD